MAPPPNGAAPADPNGAPPAATPTAPGTASAPGPDRPPDCRGRPPATPVIQRSATARPAAAVPSGTCSHATVICDGSWPVVSTRRPSVARALARCPRRSAAVSPPGSCAVTVTVAPHRALSALRIDT